MLEKLKSLKNNQGFKKYFYNTSWLFAHKALSILSGLFIGVWVARFLGPEQFGVFSYVLAFTAIFGGVAKLGLDSIIVRDLIKYPEERDLYLGTAFWLKVIGAFLMMGLIAIILPFTSNDSTTNLYIFIISLGLIFQSLEVVAFYFQSQVQSKFISICQIIQIGFSSLLKIYLVLKNAELVWFILVTGFDSFSLGISLYFSYRLRKNPSFIKYFKFNIAKQLLKDSWPLIFSSIVIMIYMRIDQVMIKELLGENEVGIYSAAVKLSEAFYFIPTIIMASLYPAIVNAKNQNEGLYKKRLQKLYTFMIWIAIAISLPFTFLSEWIIQLFFGVQYIEAGQILKIHIWSSIFVFMGVVSSKWLLTENLQNYNLINTTLGAIVNVFLNLVLIPKYGIVGAAISTIISYAIAAYFSLFLWEKTRSNFYDLSKSFLGRN